MDRTHKFALFSLGTNIAFAAYYLVFGILWGSRWILSIGSYYVVLSISRFVVLQTGSGGRFIARFTGWMLMILSIPLAETVFLTVTEERGQKFHMIVMIAMAAYSFTRITLATVDLVKSRHSRSEKTITLRNLSFADAVVSIFSLQRSMLISFEGMTESEIFLMNSLTGTGTCIIVFLLGLNLVKKKKVLFKALEK